MPDMNIWVVLALAVLGWATSLLLLINVVAGSRDQKPDSNL